MCPLWEKFAQELVKGSLKKLTILSNSIVSKCFVNTPEPEISSTLRSVASWPRSHRPMVLGLDPFARAGSFVILAPRSKAVQDNGCSELCLPLARPATMPGVAPGKVECCVLCFAFALMSGARATANAL